ncbi:hypothetical protein [Nocardioides jejuensis]|uniref:Rhomboid family intramembrane serine protease n=1 Tax=Nocardioides jejuensis TaxID=2502782 RepID=A0A4R1BVT4_9ACTN|nr:hypothetical protein [Nocardioides jejuensis]TCJ22094.1 hypothetical protein EPD65_13805 [Nocardioides jejuensis]
MSPSGGAPHDPWFRIGTLDVNTTVLWTILSGVAMLYGAITLRTSLSDALTLDPDAILHGEIWRVVTWPFSYPGGVGLWPLLTIVFFWYFGRDLEEHLLGRARMMQLLLSVTVIFAVVAVMIEALVGDVGPTVGDATLRTVEFVVLLAWVAEWPHRQFMFNIPAWVVGLVFFALQLIDYLQHAFWWMALYLVVGLLLSAIAARSIGMLSEHHIVPKIHLPHRQKRRGAARHEHGPRARRAHRHPSEGPTVVTGPWQGSGAPVESPDEARMNALLEKIHASGQASLTSAEQKELLALRDRLRGRG